MHKVQIVCREAAELEQAGRTIHITEPRSLLVTRNVLGMGVRDRACVTRCVDFEHYINTSLFRCLFNISEYGK